MAGYTRQSSSGIVDGGVISAEDLNNEFNQLATTFASGGHKHTGAAGESQQIDGTGITTGAISSDKLASNAVTTVKITDANVTAAKLAADSVITAKILDANVTSAKLASDSVITAKILDANVTAAKLATDSVITAKLADDAVTGAKIDSGTTINAASFVGPLTGAVTGNVAGDVTSAIVDSDAYHETVVALTGTTPTADLTDAPVFTITLSGATTFTFSNPVSSGTAQGFTIVVTQHGSSNYNITWPASVKWQFGVDPVVTLSASAKDIFSFFTIDGGTTYYGFVAGQGMS